jgi:CHAT domain-containing protein
MPTLWVPGVKVPPEKPKESLLGGALTIETLHASRVEALVRGAAVPELPVDAADDDIVEIELEGGVREWTSVAQLRADLEEHGIAAPDRSAAPPPVDGERIPVLLPRGPQTRSAGGWILKGLQIFHVSPSDALAKLAAQEIVAKFEDERPTPSGVYPCPDDFVLDSGKVLKPGDVAADGTLLVFLHGTASSTQGSFSKLAGTQEWKDLRGEYGARIFVLEHHTLSVSPLQNAIDLLTVLPAGAALHLVSHSRGGLIGELLCRGAVAESDLAPFAKRPDLELFHRFGELLRDKRPRIERFVRVACPARGTLLASRRLDRYLSVILNLFRLIPVLRTPPLDVLYEILRATLLTLAKERTDPKELPGLEAMMPESPVIHLLNQAATASGELGVIAGDIQGQGVWGSLKVFATDVFYREDHDLVVNTRSMYGGAAREKVSVFFDKGPDVNHFSYFGNETSRRRLPAWLLRDEGERRGLFTEIRPAPAGEVRGEALREEDRRDVVFLVPDFLGSQLGDDRGWIWPDLKALTHGGLLRLSMDRRVDVGPLVPQPYADLVTLLSHQVRVVPLPYDWRASVLDSADRLAAEVAAELDRHDRRVSFLAHGMGGLVMRALVARKEGLWGRIRERGGQLVLLGTPSHGTLFAARLLLGEETLLRQLDLLDIGHEAGELTQLFAAFPAVLEMLPEGGEIDLFNPASWTEMAQACLKLGIPAPQALAAARNARAELDAALRRAEAGTEGLVYVAGSAPWTPARLTWRGKPGKSTPVFEGTQEGDGRVPHALGRLTGVPTWYAKAPHGGLARDGVLFAALLELLQRGETRLLPSRPPEGATPELLPAPSPEPLLFPDQDELLAAAFGYDLAAPAVADLLALQVSVAHGDLKHAHYPVTVGHYEHDTIVSAEKLLDRQLKNALSERHRLGLYPGPKGTVEVVLVPGSSPPGALVIGLGEVGRISPALVRDGVARVALRYALTVAKPAGTGEAGPWRPATISAVLLGTGGGRPISIEESVTAIVEGVLQANRALRDQGFWDRVRIDGVEIVELYEAVAIQAAHAARGLASQLRSRLREHERIEAATALSRLPGGKVRQPVSYYYGGWWRRLQILRETDHELSFEVLTERARTEKTRLTIQPALVDYFVREASTQAAYPRQVAETLFELLLPYELKEQAQEETNLVLLLTEDTAQYPWELLADRSSTNANGPFVTCVGVIRQLRTEQNEFRPVVRVPRDRLALVVGDPSSLLPELRSAQAEACEVAEALKAGGYAPNHLSRPSGWEVIRELYAQDYQILHLAGHGQYDASRPEASGVVIGPGLFLTAAELRQLRPVPPFIFINCCHLGSVAQPFPHLAASLAVELIKMGVRALVVAGWAVEDNVARIFARRLYEALLSGQRFGQAVLLARQAAYRERPEGNTWGAYQCYGDPDFTFDLRRVQESAQTDPASYVSPREFLDEFAGLQGEAQVATDAAVWDTLRQRAADLDRALPADWRDGEMLSALAGVRGDLGDWKRAIEDYRQAIITSKATVTVQDLESLANLEARYAARLKSTGIVDESLGDSGKLRETAQVRLHWLLQLGTNSERLSLVGSAYKRIALAAENEEARTAVLQKGAGFYWQAHKMRQEENGTVDPYPALNWVACQIALGPEETEDLLGLIDACEREGARLAEADSKFFHRLHASDAMLHRHLILNDLDQLDVEPKVVASYRQVLQTGASFKEVSSVAEHLEFLREMIRERSPEMADALLRIRHSLGVMAPPDALSPSASFPSLPIGGRAIEEGGRGGELTASSASRTGTKHRRKGPSSGRKKSPAD